MLVYKTRVYSFGILPLLDDLVNWPQQSSNIPLSKKELLLIKEKIDVKVPKIQFKIYSYCYLGKYEETHEAGKILVVCFCFLYYHHYIIALYNTNIIYKHNFFCFFKKMGILVRMIQISFSSAVLVRL